MYIVNYPVWLRRERGEGIETKTFETREELFSFLKSLVNSPSIVNRSYVDWDKFLEDVQVTGSDMRLDYWGGLVLRRLTIMEDGRHFDPRPYLEDIKAAAPYHYEYKPKGEAHNYVGYGPARLRRPSFKNHLTRRAQEVEDFKEWGVKPSIDSRHWWWYEEEFVRQTRSWKDKSKSRKQWGKYKPNPIKRGYADRDYGDEVESEEEDIFNGNFFGPFETQY